MHSDFKITERTSEKVVFCLASDGGDRRHLAFLDPTTGTKVISPALDRKIRKALWRVAYRLTFLLYLRLLGLYVRELVLQSNEACNHVARYFFSQLTDRIFEYSHRDYGLLHLQGFEITTTRRALPR
jgi:hypothetical protein